jgi:hypothetical protein
MPKLTQRLIGFLIVLLADAALAQDYKPMMMDTNTGDIKPGIGGITTNAGGWYKALNACTNWLPVASSSNYITKSGNLLTGCVTNTGAGGGGAATTNEKSYISGCWVDYVNTTTVTINVGEGWCNDHYFGVTAAFNYASANWNTNAAGVGSATLVTYIYIDDSGSTYPNSLTVYSSTNTPTQDGELGGGWYCPTSTADRLIGSVPSTGGVIVVFENAEGWRLIGWKNAAYSTLGSAMNPSGGWQAPDDAELAERVSAAAASGLVQFYNTDSANVSFYVAPKEAADAGLSIWLFMSRHGTSGERTYRVPLGPSRNLRFTGEDNDDNNLYFYFYGYLDGR